MITVRFPSGFSVQYNTLNRIVWARDNSGSAHLYGSKADGTICDGWSVTVPRECVIELIQPCRTYNASGPGEDLKAEVAALRKEIRALARRVAEG